MNRKVSLYTSAQYAVLIYTPATGYKFQAFASTKDEAVALARCLFNRGLGETLALELVEAFEPSVSPPDPRQKCPLCV